MIFGDVHSFAVEIGEVNKYPETSGLYVQFRFWVGDVPMGDWNDRISLVASIGNARTFCDTARSRRQFAFGPSLPGEVFEAVYYSFLSWDYDTQPALVPNLRDRFHLDDIGMGAIKDRYGIVLVATLNGYERIIAKDFIRERFIADVSTPSGFVDGVLSNFIGWATSRLCVAKEEDD